MEKVPLDILEAKIGLLNTIMDISNLNSTDICILIQKNFNVQCTEQDVRLLIDLPVSNIIDEAVITFKNIL